MCSGHPLRFAKSALYVAKRSGCTVARSGLEDKRQSQDTIFNQWNPLKEFHRLMEENDLLMEELEAQGINTKRSTIILNKFKDTQAEDQAQSTKMEIGSTTQRQHKPIPSQGLSKNSHSTSQPVACNLPQQAPRLNQDYQASIHEEMIRIGQTLQGQYQQLDAMCRMNAQGPHHQLQEDEEMGYEQ
ncbi:hypothetical protein PSTT_15724 [Puccinia striiformis]|uniref:Uncharacterized protein n=1 Tax=Puccinia striiformis TaxID=27350 RepID=A0A2S4UGM7_9BASI|nr:hypothetical protein PSTT_15724 [Puccinia striiformis]